MKQNHDLWFANDFIRVTSDALKLKAHENTNIIKKSLFANPYF